MVKHHPDDLQEMIAMAQARRAMAQARLAAQTLNNDPAFWRGKVAGLEHALAEAQRTVEALERQHENDAALLARLQAERKAQAAATSAAVSAEVLAQLEAARRTIARLEARVQELEALWDDE